MTKIKQKVTTIVKKNGVIWMDYNPNSKVLIARKNEEGEFIKGQFPVFLTSGDPRSTHFSQYLSNTGMTDFVGGRQTEFVKTAKVDNDTTGAKVVFVNKELIVDNIEVNVEMSGTTAKYGIKVDAKHLIEDEEGLTVPTHSGEEKLVHWLKVVPGSVSQTRKGDLKFIPLEMSTLTWLKTHYNYSITSYSEILEDTIVFNASKALSRVGLAASSGKAFDIAPGFKYSKTQFKTYAGLDGEEVQSRVFIFTNDNGEAFRVEEFPQDFEVRIKEKVILNDIIDTKEEQSIGITEGEYEFIRPATDGIIYTDAKWAKRVGMEKDHQFRWSYVTKGLNHIEPTLREKLGVDVVLFEGAVKGDPAVYFENNILDYFVLNETRHSQEENDLFISRQYFGAISLLEPEMLEVLRTHTRDILKKAFNFDDDALKLFVGLSDEEDVDGEKILDIENLTAIMYESNPALFKASATNKNKLLNLVSSSIGELVRGARLYAPNTSYKHMMVDPVMIVEYISRGFIGVDASKVKQEGIRRGQAITSAVETRKFKDGTRQVFLIEHKKAALFRFPFLHQFEGQLVNADGGSWMCSELVDGILKYDHKTAAAYQTAISEGYYQGVLVYSLWDMFPEGQSGADFDGDTTGYTTEPTIVDKITRQPLFLDYSLLNGELVEGVPWKGSVTPPLESIVSKEDVTTLKTLGVRYNKGSFTYDKSLMNNEQLEEILAGAMGVLSGLSNTESHIGKFTNINTSIMEIILMLKGLIGKVNEKLSENPGDYKVNATKALIQKELDGYNKLSFLMASAIRWEIDKAKHGGTFMKKMPWLNEMIEGVDKPETLRLYEEKYGISLERLFYGSLLKTDEAVNTVLSELNTAMPVLSLNYAPKLHKPRISSTIYKGKNEIKGAEYIGSPYGIISEEIEQLRDDVLGKPVLESKEGYRAEAIQVIEAAREQGIDLTLPSLQEARQQLKEGVPASASPVHLLAQYRSDFSLYKTPLNEFREQLLSKWETQTNRELYDDSKATLNWLIKKVDLTIEEQDEISKAIAEFDLMMSKYEALSQAMDSSSYGEYEYAPALLHAQLYIMTMRENINRKERQTQKQLEELTSLFHNRYGQTPHPQDAAKLKAIAEAKVEEMNEGGFSSIQSLFPLGAVQFLQLLNDNKSVSERRAGRNVSVYLESNQDLTDKEKEIWSKLIGKEVTFENGRLYHYNVNQKEDLLGLEEKTVNPDPKELTHLSEDLQKFIMSTNFKRGAKNWMGAKQTGTIVHAKTYKSSVKVWLLGMRGI